MSVFKLFIFIVLGVALVLVGVPAIYAGPLEATLLNPAAYKDALVQEGVYAKMPEWLAQSAVTKGIPTLVGLDNAKLAVSSFHLEDYQTLINQVAPSAYLQQQVESLVDQGSAYLNGTANQFSPQLDLRPVKTVLQGDPSADVADLLMSTWPQCSPEEVLALPQLIAQGQLSRQMMCQPPGMLKPIALSMVKLGVVQYGKDLPDSIGLAQLSPQLLNFGADLAGYQTLWAALRLAPFAALVLAAILGLFALLSSARTRPLGIPLTIAGVIAILLTLGGLIVGELAIAGQRSAAAAASAGLINAALDALTQVGGAFLLQSGLIALVVTAIGLLLIISGREQAPKAFAPSQKRKK